MSQYDSAEIFFIRAAGIVLEEGVGEIPEVGPILAGLVKIFYPEGESPETPDVWTQIKDQVIKQIHAAISDDDWNRSSATVRGMTSVLKNYQQSTVNGENVQQNWSAAHTTFIQGIAGLQQKGDEVLLLHLYAQAASLHLSLIREGVLQNFCNLTQLRVKLKEYTCWCESITAQAIQAQIAASSNTFNAVNTCTRFMEINVGQTVANWIYLDTQLYPNPVTPSDSPVSKEIFYSIGEVGKFNTPWPDQRTSVAKIKYIAIWSLLNVDDNGYNMVQLCQTTYQPPASDTGPLYGNSQEFGGKTPQLGQQYLYYGEERSIDAIQADIIRVAGDYSLNGYIRQLQFVRADQWFGVPSQVDGSGDSNFTFNLQPPDGYWLSSMWMPTTYGNFYGAPADAVFGFRKGTVPPDTIQRAIIPYTNGNGTDYHNKCPVAGSSNWVNGWAMQYAVQYKYNKSNGDPSTSTVSNLGPWSQVFTGSDPAPSPGVQGAWPVLQLPNSPYEDYTFRWIWRRVLTNPDEPITDVGNVDNFDLALWSEEWP